MPTVVELETLLTKFQADNSDLLKKLDEIEKRLIRVAKVSDAVVRGLENTFKSFTNTVVHTALSIVDLDKGFIGVIERSVELAAKAEDLKITFEVLLHSAEDADKTIKSLYKFAAETPFRVPEVVESAKEMLAFGEEAENLIPTLKMLGDITSVSGKPLKELVEIFGRMKSQGTVSLMNIHQLTRRGIPIYLELAKVLNLVDKAATKEGDSAHNKINKMVHDGRITFELIDQAFKNMTGKGGQFEGMTEKRSKGLSGLFSNLMDDIDDALRDVGKDIADKLQLKDVVKNLSELTKEYRALDPTTKQAIMVTAALAGGFVALTGAALTIKATLYTLQLAYGTYVTWTNAATTATLALKAAAFGLGAYLGYEFGQAVIGVRSLNDEVNRNNQLLDKQAGMIDEKYTKILNDAREIADTDKRREVLSAERAKADAQRMGIARELAKQEEKTAQILKDKAVQIPNPVDPSRPFVLAAPKDQAEVNEAIQRYNDLAVQLLAVKKGYKALFDEIQTGQSSVGGSMGNSKEALKVIEQLKEQTKELGQTHTEKLISKAESLGANKDQIDAIKNYALLYEGRKIQTDQIEEEKKKREHLKTTIDSTVQSLESELYTLRHLKDEYKVKQLSDQAQKEGITKQVEGKIDLLKYYEREITYEKELAKRREEAKKILEDIATPLQKFLEQNKVLNNLLQHGDITFEQFQVAMSKADEKLQEATGSAKELENALRGVDAALSNSAEAKGRINAFLELIKLQKEVKRVFAVEAPAPRSITSIFSPEVKEGRGFIQPFEDNRRFPGLRPTVPNNSDNFIKPYEPFGPPRPMNAPPPNVAEQEAVNVLIKIYELMLQSSKKPTVTIEPVDINR